jgi:hypothetical protein
MDCPPAISKTELVFLPKILPFPHFPVLIQLLILFPKSSYSRSLTSTATEWLHISIFAQHVAFLFSTLLFT